MSKLPAIGFLGAGAIVRAMVDGFCTRAGDAPYPLVVSDRSGKGREELARKYPNRVSAAASFQECVDRSDWVVLAVLPEAGEEVVRQLAFRPEQRVVNLMFDKTAGEIRAWMNCEVERVFHMIPGTYLSFCPGPIVLCPPSPEAEEIFGRIGEVVCVESRYQAAAFGAVTGLFAPVFAVMDRVIDWAVREEGTPEEETARYVTSLFAAVCQEACGKDRAGVRHMAAFSTPGGINMQALELLERAGAFEAWRETLRPIMARASAGIPRD